jgi:hypothetical protein
MHRNNIRLIVYHIKTQYILHIYINRLDKRMVNVMMWIRVIRVRAKSLTDKLKKQTEWYKGVFKTESNWSNNYVVDKSSMRWWPSSLLSHWVQTTRCQSVNKIKRYNIIRRDNNNLLVNRFAVSYRKQYLYYL